VVRRNQISRDLGFALDVFAELINEEAPNTATRTTLSLSIGATRAASLTAITISVRLLTINVLTMPLT
jgi:hypothetical protein